jgi:hypothetical protein
VDEDGEGGTWKILRPCYARLVFLEATTRTTTATATARWDWMELDRAAGVRA